MRQFEIIRKTIKLQVYKSQKDLPSDEEKLAQKAREAMKTAYSPYSHFKVGAAVLLKNGTIVQGSNQENASYGVTLCAERTALFTASASGFSKDILKLAVIGRPKDAVQKAVPLEKELWGSPCGACRQVMKEYEILSGKPFIILCVLNTDRVYRALGVDTLLPFAFELS